MQIIDQLCESGFDSCDEILGSLRDALERDLQIQHDDSSCLGLLECFDEILNIENHICYAIGQTVDSLIEKIVLVDEIGKRYSRVSPAGREIEKTHVEVIEDSLNQPERGRERPADKTGDDTKYSEDTLESSSKLLRCFLCYNQRFSEMLESTQNIVNIIRADREYLMPGLGNGLNRSNDCIDNVLDGREEYLSTAGLR